MIQPESSKTAREPLHKWILFRLYVHWRVLRSKWRPFWFRQLGADIGRHNQFGKISMPFPKGIVIGHNCLMEDRVRLYLYQPFSGSTIHIGDNNFIGSGTQININGDFRLGNDCLIAANCIFSDANHNYDDLETPIRLQGCRYENIRIEDNVWLGAGVTVLSGVSIHQGAIVAAGAVVNRDIPAYEVWGGVPARKIKDREPLNEK